jgi:hypothetical protein
VQAEYERDSSPLPERADLLCVEPGNVVSSLWRVVVYKGAVYLPDRTGGSRGYKTLNPASIVFTSDTIAETSRRRIHSLPRSKTTGLDPTECFIAERTNWAVLYLSGNCRLPGFTGRKSRLHSATDLPRGANGFERAR